jgi:hypothetical protein
MTLHIKRFDITSIGDDSVIVFVGKRRTGKSFLVKDVLYYHRDIPIGTIISGTEAASPFYVKITPSIFIHNEYTPELLATVVKRQQVIKKKMNKMIRKCGSSNIDPRAILLLDDCLFDNSWIKDKNIRYMFMNGRHCSTLFMITMQYPLGIPPSLRTNIDYVFILRENNIKNRKRIYENYASMFPTFDMFCMVMDQCTENYECLAIKINAQSNKLQDQVFWYKAAHHSDFKVGAKEFWDAHDANCEESSDEEDEEMFDASQYQKKRHASLSIKKGD